MLQVNLRRVNYYFSIMKLKLCGGVLKYLGFECMFFKLNHFSDCHDFPQVISVIVPAVDHANAL